MLILLQIDVVAKIFDPNPWNFYTKNRSLSALWIFFQNYYCIFRSRMASFSYIYFGMKHHVYMGEYFLLSIWADACTKQMHGGLTDGWIDWHSFPWMSFDTLINFGLSHISLASVLFFSMASHLYQITYLSRAGIWVSDLGFRPLGWDLDLKAGM